MAVDYAAVILAGGTAVRMDGVDKAGVEYAGRTLLEHALAAVRGAVEVVVVGDTVPTSRPATFVREDPPHGGPAAGLLAGRDALLATPSYLAVLAVDMPRVTRRHIPAAPGRRRRLRRRVPRRRVGTAARWRACWTWWRLTAYGQTMPRACPSTSSWPRSNWPRSPPSRARPATSTRGRTCAISGSNRMASQGLRRGRSVASLDL